MARTFAPISTRPANAQPLCYVSPPTTRSATCESARSRHLPSGYTLYPQNQREPKDSTTNFLVPAVLRRGDRFGCQRLVVGLVDYRRLWDSGLCVTGHVSPLLTQATLGYRRSRHAMMFLQRPELPQPQIPRCPPASMWINEVEKARHRTFSSTLIRQDLTRKKRSDYEQFLPR